MKLGSVRELEGNRPVLKDPNSSGPDPVYWVFSDLTPIESGLTDLDTWANLTVIAPGLYGNEYPKTFGHYHGTNVDEIYHLISGDGILQLQSKHMENGVWIKNRVDEVLLIKVKPGEEVLITPEWGHSWSNVGIYPLLSFDNWRAGHSTADYEDIKSLQGLAYYLIEDPSTGSPRGDSVEPGQGKVKAVPNPNYKALPEPEWLSALEFAQRQKTNKP